MVLFWAFTGLGLMIALWGVGSGLERWLHSRAALNNSLAALNNARARTKGADDV